MNGKSAASTLGELVMAQLRALDQVAYVRFASVYRNFQDTTEFMEEVRELVNRARYEARGQQEMFEAPGEQAGGGNRGVTNETAEMPFLDHLEELRRRIIWALLALGYLCGARVLRRNGTRCDRNPRASVPGR